MRLTDLWFDFNTFHFAASREEDCLFVENLNFESEQYWKHVGVLITLNCV